MPSEWKSLPTRQQLAKARRLLRFAKDELGKAAQATRPDLAWGFWAAAAKHADMALSYLGYELVDNETPDDDTSPGFQDRPQDFPSDQLSRRAMEAIQRAFADEFADELVPNVTLVATMPPDGRIAVASTEPDAEMILMALKEGWGAAHRTWRLGRERAQRQ